MFNNSPGKLGGDVRRKDKKKDISFEKRDPIK
jgi:hypothetical protein